MLVGEGRWVTALTHRDDDENDKEEDDDDELNGGVGMKEEDEEGGEREMEPIDSPRRRRGTGAFLDRCNSL